MCAPQHCQVKEKFVNRKDQEENAAGGEVKELVTWFCDLSASQAPSFRSHSHKSKLQVKVTITGHSDGSSQSQSCSHRATKVLKPFIPTSTCHILFCWWKLFPRTNCMFYLGSLPVQFNLKWFLGFASCQSQSQSSLYPCRSPLRFLPASTLVSGCNSEQGV